MKQTLIAVFVVAVLFTCGVAHAKRVATLENGKFVVQEITEPKILLEIPGVPEGLDDVKIVGRLVSGELSEYKIEDKVGQSTNTFRFPWAMSETTYSDESVSYEDGNWTHNPLPVRTAPNTKSIPKTIIFVGIPLLAILLVSVACPLYENSLKTLPFLYLAISAGILGGTVGSVWFILWSILLVAVACAVAGAFCSRGDSEVVVVAVIAGLVACIGGLEFKGNIQPYALFLLGVEVNSFLLACLVAEIRRVRKELHKKSLRLERDVNRVRHKLLYSSYRN